MTFATRRSLLFGVWCAGAGLLSGLLVLLIFGGGAYVGLPWAAPLAGLVSGASLWRLLPERRPAARRRWGAVAGGLAGLVAHYFTWYFQFLGFFLCHLLTGGCVGSLGEPPAGPLEALAGAAGLTFFSWWVCGWLTAPLGAVLGWLFGRRGGSAS